MSHAVLERQMQEIQAELDKVEAELGKLRPIVGQYEVQRERLIGGLMGLQEAARRLEQAPPPGSLNGDLQKVAAAIHEPVAS